jgi:hypothetical protein
MIENLALRQQLTALKDRGSIATNAACHTWEMPDKNGYYGAAASIVIPWFADRYAEGADWCALAWWIHDHLPYSHPEFYPKLCASNIQWRERPRRRIDSFIKPKGCLTSQSQREPVDKAADYIENNQARLRYNLALAQGLPIATGVIEGACRHLVKDRMDITGARWGLDQAEAILKLRSLKISGDLESYLTFHFEQEHKRNYPGPPVPVLLDEAA